MEAADVMYGVTMEEKGVTMLVSVDFRGKKGPAAEAPKKRVLAQGPFAAPESASVAEAPAAEAPAPETPPEPAPEA
jgi:hypothetical protein